MISYGRLLQQCPIHEPIKVADLIYYDGPILSRFIDSQGVNYLYYWCDSDEVSHRWLVVPISESTYKDYIAGKVTLLDVLLNPSPYVAYLFDIDAKINVIASYQVDDIASLPKEYFPSSDSYYEFEPIVYRDAFEQIARKKHKKCVIIRLSDYQGTDISSSEVRNILDGTKFLQREFPRFESAVAASFQFYLIKEDSNDLFPNNIGNQEFINSILSTLSSGEIDKDSENYVKSIQDTTKHLKMINSSIDITLVDASGLDNNHVAINRQRMGKLYTKATEIIERKGMSINSDRTFSATGRFRSIDIPKRKFGFQNTTSGENLSALFDDSFSEEDIEGLFFTEQYKIYFKEHLGEKPGYQKPIRKLWATLCEVIKK